MPSFYYTAPSNILSFFHLLQNFKLLFNYRCSLSHTNTIKYTVNKISYDVHCKNFLARSCASTSSHKDRSDSSKLGFRRILYRVRLEVKLASADYLLHSRDRRNERNKVHTRRSCVSMHVAGSFHNKMDESTLLKDNPWPFNDGMRFNIDRDERVDVNESGPRLIIPHVLLKDKVSDLEVTRIGIGKISVRTYEIDGVFKGIRRIWCEWLGDCDPNQEHTPLFHDFAIVKFAFHYDLGRAARLDEISKALQENEDPVSDPDGSLGEQWAEDQASDRSSSSIREELRVAKERNCDICKQLMLPGKDVAALLNTKTDRLVCSSTNLTGAFHVFHISCLIHWVLLCDSEVYAKQPASPELKKRRKRAKISSAEKEERNQIYCPFCPECQGSGIEIDGDKIKNREKPTVDQQEVFKYKKKLGDGVREYIKDPEMLQNCSTGFHFPPKSKETTEGVVLPWKRVLFYRAVEE